MTTIDFSCERAPLIVAIRLADAVFVVPQDDFLPFVRDSSGNEGDAVDRSGAYWYELSMANDHKLDVRGPGRFTYRDRYNNPKRIARIRQALAELGAVVAEESP